jgi:hypothetical protein
MARWRNRSAEQNPRTSGEHRSDVGETLQNGRLQVKLLTMIFCGDAAKRSERMPKAAEETLHRLRDGELNVHQSAVGEHDDEEEEPAASVAHWERAENSPVDLRALTGSEVQLEIDGQFGWANAEEVLAGSCQPLGDGLAMKTERARNLGDGQPLTIPAVADPGERLVVDHDRLRGQGGGMGGP